MRSILVIEDDLAILRGLTVNLTFESYEVLTATDGETGYDLLRTKPAGSSPSRSDVAKAERI